MDVMRRTLGLSRRQKIFLAVLFAGDMALLLAGFLIVRGAPSVGAAAPAPSALTQTNCQAIGAQLLAQHNLAGVARLDPDGSLRFELSGQDASGHLLPRASEAAWDALAAALAVPDAGCGPYPMMRVDVPDPNGPPGGRLLVQVDWIDLRAWGKGELDDGELASRVTATTYVHPEPVQP
jgi:hypothetical protein